MKKLKGMLAVLLAVLIFAGCTPVTDDNSGRDNRQQTIDIAAAQEKLTDYFQPLNIALNIQWDETGGQLLEKPNFLKAVLEDIYRHKTGEIIPNESGSVKIDTYVNVAGWNFPFDKEAVRKALEGSYGYNRENDTVYMSDGLGNVCTSEIRNVQAVGENILMVTYRYGVQDDYNEEDDKWYFSDYNTRTMLVRLEADGYTFLSNRLQGEKETSISSADMKLIADETVITAIQQQYNRASILMGYSWDVSSGLILFEGTAQLGFHDALLGFYGVETGQSMARDINGEYRVYVADYIAQAVKYFPFSTQTLRRYYTADSSYDAQTDTVLAPDGYGNVCRAQVQQVFTDGEHYVVEYHYVWPEGEYDTGRTLLKKADNGNFIFLANIRDISN